MRERADRSPGVRVVVRGAALAAALLVCAGSPARAADPELVRVFEQGRWPVEATELDRHVAADHRRLGVHLARPCTDAVFFRRVHLDLVGAIPDPGEAAAFLADRDPDKRARLIDRLLRDDRSAGWFALRWCDVLRVKSEFPINLWPNAVQAYHRWVRDALARNVPYDVFARELLTSSGSNFRVPAVNFLRAVQSREPEALGAAAALTFMGQRTELWPAERRSDLAAFFSRVATKRTKEWKEEVVHLDPGAWEPLSTRLPDGREVTVPAWEDPRRAFADWLITPDNPWFARCAVNRLWAWLFGRGIVDPPDDLRETNPPILPRTLDHLAAELVASGWDTRHVLRIIVSSRTYQQSPLPAGDVERHERAFACYPVRRIEAEVLMDALSWLAGEGEGYSSPVPEPYTFVPEENRTVELADGSITSPFLELFGRPSRDTGLFAERSAEPSDDQRLFLLNSSDVLGRLERSPHLREVLRAVGTDVPRIVEGVYLTLLARPPTDGEAAAARAHFVAGGRPLREAVMDLAWALLNSKEFLYRH